MTNAKKPSPNMDDVINSLDDYAIFTMDTKRIITSWSMGAEKIMCYKENEIVGKSADAVFTDTDRKNKAPYKEQKMAEEKGDAIDERWHVKKDGTLFWASGKLFPLYDDTKKIIGFTKIMRDLTSVKKAELALKESEERHNKLLEQQQIDQERIAFAQNAGKIGTFGWDLISGKATWTKEFELLYGYKDGGFKSKNTKEWIKYVHEDDKKFVLTETRRTLKDPSKTLFYVEFRVVWPDNTIHYLATRAKILRDIKGKALKLIGVNIDITGRKKVENNLMFISKVSKVLSSTLDYKKVLDYIAKLSVPEIADWCGISMRTEDGRIDQVAVAHTDPKKVKWAKELNKKNPPDPDAETGAPNILRTGKAELYPYVTQEMFEKSARNEEELKLLRKLQLSSVMMLPICLEGKAIAVITFVYSESGRHYNNSDLVFAEEIASRAANAIQNAKLYESAQENERKFKSFVESNIVGVFTSGKDGMITECNEGFLKIIGYTRDDLNAKKLNRWKLTPTEYIDIDTKSMKDLYQNNSTAPWEKEYIKKDGSQVPVIVGSTLINRKTGENITIVLDITERKRLEQRKDEFIGIASHELKTPLTSIKGYTQILERIIQQMSDERLKTYLKKTNIYINRLDSLIADLLDVSRIQAGKLQFNMSEFNLKELIKDSIDAIQPTSTKHKILCTECPDVTIYGDMHRLEQVFMNLLSNALKYSPDAEQVEVEIKKTSKQITVSVKDYGVGISKKNISKLFERFYRVEKTAKQFSGLGIGLYISSEIVLRHGGKIAVDSEEGKGSKFTVTLPINKRTK